MSDRVGLGGREARCAKVPAEIHRLALHDPVVHAWLIDYAQNPAMTIVEMLAGLAVAQSQVKQDLIERLVACGGGPHPIEIVGASIHAEMVRRRREGL